MEEGRVRDEGPFVTCSIVETNFDTEFLILAVIFLS